MARSFLRGLAAVAVLAGLAAAGYRAFLLDREMHRLADGVAMLRRDVAALQRIPPGVPRTEVQSTARAEVAACVSGLNRKLAQFEEQLVAGPPSEPPSAPPVAAAPGGPTPDSADPAGFREAVRAAVADVLREDRARRLTRARDSLLTDLRESLQLSAAQKNRLDQILLVQQMALDELRADRSLGAEAFCAAADRFEEGMHREILSVLTPDQWDRYRFMAEASGDGGSLTAAPAAGRK